MCKDVLEPYTGNAFFVKGSQVQAFQLVRETKGTEATPSYWQPGKLTLKIS